MFYLEGFVEDKHLPKVLHLLDGLVIDLKQRPVRNAVKGKNGSVHSTAAHSTTEAIVKYATERKLSVISAKQVSEALSVFGFAPAGYSNACSNAIKNKVLKKSKTRGQYVVVNGGK